MRRRDGSKLAEEPELPDPLPVYIECTCGRCSACLLGLATSTPWPHHFQSIGQSIVHPRLPQPRSFQETVSPDCVLQARPESTKELPRFIHIQCTQPWAVLTVSPCTLLTRPHKQPVLQLWLAILSIK